MAKSTEVKREHYLLITEKREHGYFHLTGRVVRRHYEQNHYQPFGPDDDYGEGLLWSGLRVGCQGDDKSRLRGAQAGESGPVYGFDTLYRDDYAMGIGVRRCKRMLKTLQLLERGMEKLYEQRGYPRSFGEYAGRVSEVLGCTGIAFEPRQKYGEQRWTWASIGDGVNQINHAIFLWQEEAKEQGQEQAS